jgi:hypothetical protein
MEACKIYTAKSAGQPLMDRVNGDQGRRQLRRCSGPAAAAKKK